MVGTLAAIQGASLKKLGLSENDADDNTSSEEDDDKSKESSESMSLRESGSEDELQFKVDEEDQKDEMWRRSRQIIESHSASVDSMLFTLRQEETILRKLLNDEVSLEEYYNKLSALLGRRLSETVKLNKLVLEEQKR